MNPIIYLLVGVVMVTCVAILTQNVGNDCNESLLQQSLSMLNMSSVFIMMLSFVLWFSTKNCFCRFEKGSFYTFTKIFLSIAVLVSIIHTVYLFLYAQKESPSCKVAYPYVLLSVLIACEVIIIGLIYYEIKGRTPPKKEQEYITEIHRLPSGKKYKKKIPIDSPKLRSLKARLGGPSVIENIVVGE